MSAKLEEILDTKDQKVIERHKKAILNSYDGGCVQENDYAGRIPFITLMKKDMFGQPVKNGNCLDYPLTESGVKLASELDAERSKRPGPVIM
jgi:hypothetical protein